MNSDTDSDRQASGIPREEYEKISRAMDELGKIDDRAVPDDVARYLEDTWVRLDDLWDRVEDDS